MRRFWTRLETAVLVRIAIRVVRRAARRAEGDRDELVWGPDPLINNKYWSAAMREGGWHSTTLMSHHYPAYVREDFDLYFEDLVPKWLRRWKTELGPYAAMVYVLSRASVLFTSFVGGPLAGTRWWREEATLLQQAGVRTVIVPFGGDYLQYSKIADPVLRHGLLTSYPDAGKREDEIAERVAYWSRHADVIVAGGMLDGLPRWDVLGGQMLCIDLEQWAPPDRTSDADGHSAPVRVLHAPNHRGAKGTSFLLDAVETLREEGLQVELELIEGRTNEEVREAMLRADVLADQFLFYGYGLAAVEAMATGLPVLCNLEDDRSMRAFRLFSFLDECPCVSTRPEGLVDALRKVVVDPDLRRTLGDEGREFVERRHSYAAAQFLFGSIHRQVIGGEDIDLMTLFKTN